MAITVGDESCRDRPIYVRVTCCKDNNTYSWYVIEEKRSRAKLSSLSSLSFSSSSSSSSSTTSSSSENDEEDCNDDVLECESEFDIIRRISVPDSELRYNSLAVLNSHIYLIGGDIDTVNNEGKRSIGYRHLELGKSEWQLGGGNLLYEQYGAAAVGHDGFIYSVGCHQYRMFPKAGILEKLPAPPPVSRLGKDALYESRLLALTKDKLFIYILLGENDSNLMVSYDLNKREWDVDIEYPSFSGLWSAGVVLYDDRYLFSFGSQDPTSPSVLGTREKVRQVVPGIYVFDIHERRWLPEPVKGLRNDGTVLPYCCETHDYETYPDSYDCGPGYSPYLLQIGKQNDRRLAMLWESQCDHTDSGLPQCLLIWSKFIISPSTLPASKRDLHFYASYLSTGSCALDEWTDQLFNCAAGM